MNWFAAMSLIFGLIQFCLWVFYFVCVHNNPSDTIGMTEALVGVPCALLTALLAFVQFAWVAGAVAWKMWKDGI